MSTKIKVLFTGITGYLGGSIYSQFSKHPDFSSYEITALVRSLEKAQKLNDLGIKTVIGAHDDEKLMESLASQSDVVLATADADSLKAAEATLLGLKKRYAETGVAPIFIHTSGTAVNIDFSAGLVGEAASDVIFDDMNVAQLDAIPDSAPHRNVDLLLVNADTEGYVKTYIILPSTIYGIAAGILVDRGIQNTRSIQIPALIKASIDRGRAGIVGEGKNIWPNVHIDDVAEMYVDLLASIKTNPATGHGREGLYFAENGEHTLYEVGRAIGDALVALGKSSQAEPTTFSSADIDKYFQGNPAAFGSNSRCRGTRSRLIGWNPKYKKEDFLKSIKPEIESIEKLHKQ